MDSKGNLYEEVGNGQLQDMEKGTITNASEVSDLVKLTQEEALTAKQASIADRLKMYEEKLGDEALVAPLTRQEREAMNTLSEAAYGKRLQWQKMLRKGEFKPETAQTSNGEALQVRRLHHFTVNEIRVTMQKILREREEAAAKAATERAAKEATQQAAELEKSNEQSPTP